MRAYTLTHLSDDVLLRDLAALVAQDRSTTAALLAHIAEVDARRLYVPAGYPSMHAYCVDELHLSEDAALKRIQAARAARQFPVLFTTLAEGRLHLTAVRLLAPHLTPENVNELLEAAAYRRRSEIEQFLAQRFPLAVPEPPARVRILPAISAMPGPQHAPGHVGTLPLDPPGEHAPGPGGNLPLDPTGEHAPGHVEGVAPPPLERYLLQVTIGKSTHDKLRYAQALLSHSVRSGDVAQVLDRALDALIGQVEKRKFEATAKSRRPGPGRGTKPEPQSGPRPDPRPGSRQRSSARKRYIPSHVKRAVWERDQGQCTFESDAGRRCAARRFLEFDHVDPVALGGRATVEGLRLRCRAHNQYEAERTFGVGFMNEKRDAARARRTVVEERLRAVAEEERDEAAREQARDVLAGLRGLGFRVDEARRAVEFTGTLHDAPIEERLRTALKFLGRKPVERSRPETSVPVSPRGAFLRGREPAGATALSPSMAGAALNGTA